MKILLQFANHIARNKALSVSREGLEALENTDDFCIQGFINTHLNALLNGSWHDIDKNLTYFDIDIEPNSQVHRRQPS